MGSNRKVRAASVIIIPYNYFIYEEFLNFAALSQNN